MATSAVDVIVRELLIGLTDDWEPIEAILGPAEDAVGNDGPEFKQLVRDVLDRVFREKLAEACPVGRLGEVEGSSPEVLDRIIANLEVNSWEPLGEGYWLMATEKGKALGRNYLREQEESQH